MGILQKIDDMQANKNAKERPPKKKKSDVLPVETYHVVDYVDLYETRAVRRTTGSSYGKKGARIYNSTSSSTQQLTKGK